MNNENDSSDITTLSKMFTKTPLRLDSYVFGFFETDKGNNLLNTYLECNGLNQPKEKLVILMKSNYSDKNILDP